MAACSNGSSKQGPFPGPARLCQSRQGTGLCTHPCAPASPTPHTSLHNPGRGSAALKLTTARRITGDADYCLLLTTSWKSWGVSRFLAFIVCLAGTAGQGPGSGRAGLPWGPAELGGDSRGLRWGRSRSLLPRLPRAALGRSVPFPCSLRGPPGQLGLLCPRPRQGRAGRDWSPAGPAGGSGEGAPARPDPRPALGARPGSHPRRGVAGPAGGLTASTACCRMEVNLENILSRDCSSRCREDLESSSMRRRRRSRVRAAYGGLAAGIGRAGAGAASRSPADTVALTPPAARRGCRGSGRPAGAATL